MCIPTKLQLKVIQENHDTPIAGHFGADKTIELIARTFWWNTMHADVRKFVKSCEQCQRNKSSNQKPARLLRPLELPTRN